MDITAAMVKQLREMTDCGMMECKKALVETDGNIEKAMDFLRERGLAKAEKKAGRIAAEGLVSSYLHADGTFVLVEVNSETDFAAKSDAFIDFVKNISTQIASNKPADVEALLTQNCINDASMSVSEYIKQTIAKLGENLNVRRFSIYGKSDDSAVDSYIHAGGKIGVLVELAFAGDKDNDAFKQAIRNIAMQVAAARPQFLDRTEISADFITKEREIQRAAAIAEGKPEKIVDKMVDGRIEKYIKEICLVDQAYIIDPDMTVNTYLAGIGKELGCPVSIKRFTRFERGEGIEKKEENFADEVAKQIK